MSLARRSLLKSKAVALLVASSLVACSGGGKHGSSIVPASSEQPGSIVAAYGVSQAQVQRTIQDAQRYGKTARYISVTTKSRSYTFAPSVPFVRTKMSVVAFVNNYLFIWPSWMVHIVYSGSGPVDTKSLPMIDLPFTDLLTTRVITSQWKRSRGRVASSVKLSPRSRGSGPPMGNWKNVVDPWQQRPDYVSWTDPDLASTNSSIGTAGLVGMIRKPLDGFSSGDWCEYGWTCDPNSSDWFSQAAYFYLPYGVDEAPVLAIYDLIGQAYVDGTNQAQTDGQPIGLDVESSNGGTLSQCQWSVPANVVGDSRIDSQAGFSSDSAELTQESLSAFWSAADIGNLISIICLDNNTDLFIGATVNYNINLPPFTASATYGAIGIDQGNQVYPPGTNGSDTGTYLHFGSYYSVMNAWSFAAPQAPQGTLSMEQTISTSGGAYLSDLYYPFTGPTSPATAGSVPTSQTLVQWDIPGTGPLESASSQSVTINQYFRDYFIYWPDAGIPVVVATSQWGWQATTTKTNGVWSAPSVAGLSKTQPVAVPYEYVPPTWPGVSTQSKVVRPQ